VKLIEVDPVVRAHGALRVIVREVGNLAVAERAELLSLALWPLAPDTYVPDDLARRPGGRPRTPVTAELRARAVDARLSGATDAEVAAQVGVSRTAVRGWVRAARSRSDSAAA
jgi:hypothetical protein